MTDEQVCIDNDAVSYIIKCNLSSSLKNGTLAYLCEEMKGERNALTFLSGICLVADEKADHRNREFKQWLDLFTMTLTKLDDCYEFINKFSLSILALKEAKSSAVQDAILLRALLLQSIQCDTFAEIMLEITKNLDMAPENIIKSLKAHKPTLDSEEMSSDIKVNMISPRQVRRSNISDGKEKFGDTKPIFRIPRCPRGLYEVCSKSLWKQLATWKMLSNKNQLNEEETKKLRDFEIYLNRPPSDDANRTRYTKVKGDN